MALSPAVTQDQPPSADAQEPDQQAQLRQKFDGVIQKLSQLAQEQVQKKKPVEARMYDDLRRYYGRYEEEVEQRLREAEKSQVYMGLTRAKTAGWESRLADLLFPTDDRNWGIKPTPVPELAEIARKHPGMDENAIAEKANAVAEQASALREQGNDQDAERMVAEANALTGEAKQAKKARQELDEARRKAEAMEREIDDQMTEARYAIKAREALHDACKLGSGILKGPLTASRTRRGWASQHEGENVVHILRQHDDPRPDWRRVDPWNYFPDMDARVKEEVEFEFERHLMNKKGLRKLARIRGFDNDAIREVLREDSPEPLPDYIAQLRDLTGQGKTTLEGRYQVWEYHGPLEAEDIRTICECRGDHETLEELPEDDPLAEINVIIWFCRDRMLKFGLHPMESGESLYSVFNFERDDSSIFGFGVPHLMRHSQRALNAAWRAMLDNAALSAEPQVVIFKDIIEPVNGSWKLTGGKQWLMKTDRAVQGAQPFSTYDIPSNQEYYANIIALAQQFASEETQMPQQLEYGQSTKMADGVGGMAMVMNSVNVVFRRVVRNFDDDFTVPNIRRAYDWNMQYSERDEIKGDYEVDARGSSVLLVRELQAQNLMVVANQFTQHSVLGPMTKAAPAYRKLMQSMMVPADEIVKDDEEIAAEQAKQAEQVPPEVQEQQLKREIQREEWEFRLQEAQLKSETDLQTAQIERETRLMTLAEQMNMKREELEAMLAKQNVQAQTDLAKTEAKQNSDERMFAAEAAVEERKDAKAAARGEQDPGSGGYIS